MIGLQVVFQILLIISTATNGKKGDNNSVICINERMG